MTKVTQAISLLFTNMCKPIRGWRRLMPICTAKSTERRHHICKECCKCHWNGCPTREQYCEATD